MQADSYPQTSRLWVHAAKVPAAPKESKKGELLPIKRHNFLEDSFSGGSNDRLQASHLLYQFASINVAKAAFRETS